MSYSTTIYKILKIIDLSFEKEGPFDTLTLFPIEKLKISEKRLNFILKELVEHNYIKGIQFVEYSDNSFLVKCYNPCLTLEGLIFLEENSAMKRAAKILKEAKDLFSLL